ncbi:erythroferrone [Sceloporus undulatus]|uniref:erythroferrone n=1 Tax=Sceloporus undulatus TaxID=8520 RepID=UPI001C4D6F06|nr:erythroferrone [Sceloporus undulatus]
MNQCLIPCVCLFRNCGTVFQRMSLLLLSGRLLQLLAMGLLAVTFCVGPVEPEKHGNGITQEKKSPWNETESLPLVSSSDQNPAIGKISSAVSRDAWLLLMKQSNNGVVIKKGPKSQPQKLKLGIPGPPGPPGLPGATITKEDMLRELRLILKGIIREREGIKTCKNCQEEEDREGMEKKLFAQMSGLLLENREPARVEAAFYCRIQKNISVERRSLQELQLYYIPKNGDVFQRGLGLNLTSGQYQAPLSGYYIFSATLHVVPNGHAKKSQLCARDRLRLLICVQSLCRQNISLKTVKHLDKNRERFTVSVTGTLFLQVGQYASVFVDNATGSSLVVQRGSDFSAVLLGV